MTHPDKRIIFATDILAANVVSKVAKAEGKPETETLRRLMATKTFSLLFDPESYLYAESPSYVLDMLEAERNEDWDTWLEV